MSTASLQPSSSIERSFENPSPTIASYSGNSDAAFPIARPRTVEISLVFVEGRSVSSSYSSHFVRISV